MIATEDVDAPDSSVTTRGGDDEAGTLFLVSTPIGNLDDLTMRAIATLRNADRIVAEDTRRTRQLLSHLGISGKPVDALHGHSTDRAVERLVELLCQGERIALVTDAGTPSVSDPGEVLTQAAIAEGVRVIPIPGASAVLAALVASGLMGTQGFRFVGFLPRDGTARLEALSAIVNDAETVVFFESPHRTTATLRELAAAIPNRGACVARELTKIHEEFVRGTLTELAKDERVWRGEVVIVLGPWKPDGRADQIDDAAIQERIRKELADGGHVKTIAERLAAWSGRSRREIYEQVIVQKQSITKA